MKTLVWFVICGVISQSTAFAEDFNIEDDQLRPLPDEVSVVIRSDKSFSDFKREGCSRLVGVSVALDETKKTTGWIATTADGCAWGAATGPIWVLYRRAKSCELVLSTGGHDLTMRKSLHGGLKDLLITSGTAGWYSESRMKFDGSRYVVARTRSVNLGDPEDCRRNKDVCPN